MYRIEFVPRDKKINFYFQNHVTLSQELQS